MTATPPSPTLTERLRTLRNALLTGLVERDLGVRLALLAALSGEHLLLVGPPGTAKSMVARRLHRALDGSAYFERLLTRFTVPEELFGPLSIRALEEDRYERLTERYLPTASVAFLDEIFKANSAILNALLTLLHEREFDNGVERVRTPLVAVVGASNELPEDGELDALYDRFLLRLHVGPVSAEGFATLLDLRGEAEPEIPAELRLTAEDLVEVRRGAEQVALSEDVKALLSDLRAWCAAEGIPVSDRRWRKVAKLLRVSAFSHGRSTVSTWDAWLLQHALWQRPEQREAIYDWYAERVGAAAAMDPSSLAKIVVAWEAQLKRDQESRSQRRDEEGRLLYEDSDGEPVPDAEGEVPAYRDGEPLYLAPKGAHFRKDYEYRPIRDRTNAGHGFTAEELDELWMRYRNSGWGTLHNWNGLTAYLADPDSRLTRRVRHQPLMEPTRFRAAYVESVLDQLDALRGEVRDYKAGVKAQIASLEAEIRTHLWVTPDFAEPAARSLEATLGEVEGLLARVERLREGFAQLPRED